MKLHDLRPDPGAKHKRKRVGRGIAAGQGKTAGRGTKGQGARGGKPKGAYWTPSPVFVHADECERFQDGNALPPFMRKIPLSVRAYDAADQMIYDVSDAVPGAEVDGLLERALGDARTRYANIHTARFGCFLCRVEAA